MGVPSASLVHPVKEMEFLAVALARGGKQQWPSGGEGGTTPGQCGQNQEERTGANEGRIRQTAPRNGKN